jgi:transposase InsO family protein
VSDRHSTFRSTTYKELMKVLGITTNFTTSYHAQSNGLVERNNRKIKAIMSATMDNLIGPNTSQSPSS